MGLDRDDLMAKLEAIAASVRHKPYTTQVGERTLRAVRKAFGPTIDIEGGMLDVDSGAIVFKVEWPPFAGFDLDELRVESFQFELDP